MTKLSETRLSTWQLMLISTGGMLGSGWLFTPYYGFQMDWGMVILAGAIAATLTILIGLSFMKFVVYCQLVVVFQDSWVLLMIGTYLLSF